MCALKSAIQSFMIEEDDETNIDEVIDSVNNALEQGADVTIDDMEGFPYFPLRLAAWEGLPEVIDILLDHVYHPNDAINRALETAFLGHRLRTKNFPFLQRRHQETIDRLVDAGGVRPGPGVGPVRRGDMTL